LRNDSLRWKVVDFVIWRLFAREKTSSWPKHLLCDGFRRHTSQAIPAEHTIPGLFVVHDNHRVRTLKAEPWPQLLLLLGQAGERIMIDLLTDCAMFETLDAGKDNLYQLSGVPISELEDKPKTQPLRPSEIVFVRNRIFYARAALNARGLVHSGLRHIRMSSSTCCCYADRCRCLESLPKTGRHHAHHDVHVSPAIWITQCLHIDGRSPEDCTVIPRLHTSRRRNCPKVPQKCRRVSGSPHPQETAGGQTPC